MRYPVNNEKRRWSAGAYRVMIEVNPRKLIRSIPLLVVVLVGCNSHLATEPAADQESPEKTVTYATHPEQFAKHSTYEPPFRITDPKTADEHFDVAVNFDNQKQPAKAVDEYEKALALKPVWAIAHFRLAKDYARLRRTDDAITNWTKAIQDSPDLYIAYAELAAAYGGQGETQKAIDVYFGLMRYPAAEMGARFQVALWYEKLGKRKEAKENFQRYRELALQHGPEEKGSERFQVALRELEKLGRQG